MKRILLSALLCALLLPKCGADEDPLETTDPLFYPAHPELQYPSPTPAYEEPEEPLVLNMDKYNIKTSENGEEK